MVFIGTQIFVEWMNQWISLAPMGRHIRMHGKDRVPASMETVTQNVLIKWENNLRKQSDKLEITWCTHLPELIAQHVISDK